jgi:hypothetical protein
VQNAGPVQAQAQEVSYLVAPSTEPDLRRGSHQAGLQPRQPAYQPNPGLTKTLPAELATSCDGTNFLKVYIHLSRIWFIITNCFVPMSVIDPCLEKEDRALIHLVYSNFTHSFLCSLGSHLSSKDAS